MAPTRRGIRRNGSRVGGYSRSMDSVWAEVDDYYGSLLAPSDAQLDTVLAANHAAGLPPIDVAQLQGKFLQVLVQIAQAPRAGDRHTRRL